MSFILVWTTQILFMLLFAWAKQLADTKLGHSKGFFTHSGGILKPWRRVLLLLLNIEIRFADDLASAWELTFLSLAAGLLPTLDGSLALNPPDSWWWFTGFLVTGTFGGALWRWTFTQNEGWTQAILNAERVLLGVSVLGLLGASVAISLGTESFARISEFQNESGWLLFNRGELLPIFFLFLILGIYLFSLYPMKVSTHEMVLGRWSLHTLLPWMKQALWIQLVVQLFLGGIDPIPVLGPVFYFLKGTALWLLIYVAAKQFVSIREDQAERLLIKGIVPVSTIGFGLICLWVALR